MDQIDKVLAKLPELLSSAFSAGLPGLIAAGVALVATIVVYFILRNARLDAIQRENDKHRVEEQAKNKQDNSKDEEQAKQAKQELEEALKKRDK